VAEGGTGVGTLTLYGVLLGNATSQVIASAAGNPYEVLRVPNVGGFPAFGAVDLGQAAAVTGLLPVAHGGTGTATPSLVEGSGISITGSWPNQTVTNTSPASALGDPVTVAHGGTGTATPSLVAGANISITGTWPNQTVALDQTQPLAITGTIPSESPASGVHIGVFAGTPRVIFGDATKAHEIDVESGVFRFLRPGEVDLRIDASGYITVQQDFTGAGLIKGDRFQSVVATGTPPLAVASTTLVTNLNAERVAGTQVTNAATSGALLIGSGAGTAAWGTPDGARVYNSAAETIANNTATALTFDSERYDNGGLHSTTSNTSRLTAQKAGKYLITGHVRWGGSSVNDRSLWIRCNGLTEIAECTSFPSNADPANMSIATVWHLAAGDYVELFVAQNSGGNLLIDAAAAITPEFAMQWLGP
jgi:hypothetical protein